MIALQPLIDCAPWHGTVELQADTGYDDCGPVMIRKDLLIEGPPTAIIHSEMQVYGGATVEIRGPTFYQSKAGAAHHTGLPGPVFPQNAQIVVRQATLYLTDVDMWHLSIGGHKPAFHLQTGVVHIRALNRQTGIYYASSRSPVIEAFYNSYCGILGFSDTNFVQVDCGADINNSGIVLASSDLLANGMSMWRYGAGPYGINAIRGSNVVIGSGTTTRINGFTSPYTITNESRLWVGPGSFPLG